MMKDDWQPVHFSCSASIHALAWQQVITSVRHPAFGVRDAIVPRVLKSFGWIISGFVKHQLELTRDFRYKARERYFINQGGQ